MYTVERVDIGKGKFYCRPCYKERKENESNKKIQKKGRNYVVVLNWNTKDA